MRFYKLSKILRKRENLLETAGYLLYNLRAQVCTAKLHLGKLRLEQEEGKQVRMRSGASLWIVN